MTIITLLGTHYIFPECKHPLLFERKIRIDDVYKGTFLKFSTRGQSRPMMCLRTYDNVEDMENLIMRIFKNHFPCR